MAVRSPRSSFRRSLTRAKERGVYLGIDPGKTGAIVALNEQGALLGAARTPVLKDAGKRVFDIAAMVNIVMSWGRPAMITIEHVHAMPRDS